MRHTGTTTHFFLSALLAGCAERPSAAATSTVGTPAPSSVPSSNLAPQQRMTGSIYLNLIELGLTPQRITFSIPIPRDTISPGSKPQSTLTSPSGSRSIP